MRDAQKEARARYYRKNVESMRAYGRQYNKQRRAARKAAGLCTVCGKAPPRPNRQDCEGCRR